MYATEEQGDETNGAEIESRNLCAAGGIKDGTSALDGVGYIAGCHVDDFFVHQSVVAFQDTFHLNALLQTSSYGCTDRRVLKE